MTARIPSQTEQLCGLIPVNRRGNPAPLHVVKAELCSAHIATAIDQLTRLADQNAAAFDHLMSATGNQAAPPSLGSDALIAAVRAESHTSVFDEK
jgi:hypothetical protein